MSLHFNINNFLSNINRVGVLQDNKYKVEIPIINGLRTSSIVPLELRLTSTSNLISMMCDVCQIPELMINTTSNLRYGYGNFNQVPVNSVLTECTLGFMMDGQAGVFNFFEHWMRLITNHDLSQGINGNTGISPGQMPFELNYKSDYVADIFITVLNNQGEPKMRIVIQEAFPVRVGSGQLSWGSHNNIMRGNVVLNYDSVTNLRV